MRKYALLLFSSGGPSEEMNDIPHADKHLCQRTTKTQLKMCKLKLIIVWIVVSMALSFGAVFVVIRRNDAPPSDVKGSSSRFLLGFAVDWIPGSIGFNNLCSGEYGNKWCRSGLICDVKRSGKCKKTNGKDCKYDGDECVFGLKCNLNGSCATDWSTQRTPTFK